MAEVDHHLGRKTRFRQTDFHLRHVLRAVVRLFAAAQNNMAVAVTAGIHDGGVAPLGDRQETVRCAGGVNRIDSHLDGAIGTVFKAHRAGESEASSRCTCDSVVRAPMAPQLIRSATYCGVIISRNSPPPAGRCR